MFVDALDAQMYEEHHSTGHCPLSLSKVSCFLKGLVYFAGLVLAIFSSWFSFSLSITKISSYFHCSNKHNNFSFSWK